MSEGTFSDISVHFIPIHQKKTEGFVLESRKCPRSPEINVVYIGNISLHYLYILCYGHNLMEFTSVKMGSVCLLKRAYSRRIKHL